MIGLGVLYLLDTTHTTSSLQNQAVLLDLKSSLAQASELVKDARLQEFEALADQKASKYQAFRDTVTRTTYLLDSLPATASSEDIQKAIALLKIRLFEYSQSVENTLQLRD